MAQWSRFRVAKAAQEKLYTQRVLVANCQEFTNAKYKVAIGTSAFVGILGFVTIRYIHRNLFRTFSVLGGTLFVRGVIEPWYMSM